MYFACNLIIANPCLKNNVGLELCSRGRLECVFDTALASLPLSETFVTVVRTRRRQLISPIQ